MYVCVFFFCLGLFQEDIFDFKGDCIWMPGSEIEPTEVRKPSEREYGSVWRIVGYRGRRRSRDEQREQLAVER